jgi:hypothetical protein
MTEITPHPTGCNTPTRIDYLLQELRCASMRARLCAGDIDAVGMALKVGLVTPEEAIEMLEDCPALQFIQPETPA